MPIYEYRRPDGTKFELQQSFSEDPLTVDPDTGVPVERVLHPPAVHFKGKGFYNTDYGTRNRQRETAAAAEKPSSTSESSSDGSASESSSDGSSSSSSSSSKKAEKGEKTDKPKEKGSKDSKPVAAKS
jgi:putative FmdB family regulatory protein